MRYLGFGKGERPRNSSWCWVDALSAAAIFNISGAVLAWGQADPPVWGRQILEVTRMHTARETPKPDETDSSTIGPAQQHGDEKVGVTNTDEAQATESHRPTKSEPGPPEIEKDEYVLEREPDGRYRIISRRPRKPE